MQREMKVQPYIRDIGGFSQPWLPSYGGKHAGLDRASTACNARRRGAACWNKPDFQRALIYCELAD